MAIPMTAAQWKAAMKKWDVPVVWRKGWEDKGRSAAHGPWGPVNGIIIHHTADDDPGTSASYQKFLFDTGRSDLPAPLCHAAGTGDGKIVMGARGRCNHAGAGTARAFNAVVAESYDGFNTELKPGGNKGVDGNVHFYGLEICYRGIDGKEANAAQYDAAVRWAAAICDFHGWTALSVIGHREWTTAKIDPGYVLMNRFRADVAALLKAGPGTTPAPAPKPTPAPKPKPKPKPAPKATATTVYGNVAGYNQPLQPGVLGFRKHIPAIAKAVINCKADIFLTNELSNKLVPKMLPLMDSSLKGKLTRAPHGYSGHYAYTAPSVTVIASGWMRAKKTAWYLNDSKEGCWIVYEVGGKRALDATFQAEHKIGRAPDAKRVQQALDFDTQIFALAAKYSVPTANVLYTPDTNSEGQVIAALVKRGRINAAAGTKYEHTATFDGWGKKTPKRYDYAVVGAGAQIVSVTVDQSKNSDHARIIVVRNLI